MKKTIAAVLIVSMVGILNFRTVVFAQEADVPSEPVQTAETGSTGWGEEDGHKVYLDTNGNKLTGIVTIEGSSYCFDSNGYMQTGLIDAGGKQYYFDDAGKMILNKTLQINGSWYRIGEDGSAVLDSADIDIIETDKGKILLLKGTQYFGWYQMPDGSWTYWDQADNGIQSISKWLLIDNNWYYFDNEYSMLSGVNDVFHNQYILPVNIHGKILGHLHNTGSCRSGTVAAGRNEVNLHIQIDILDQLTHPHDGALQRSHHDEFLARIILCNSGTQLLRFLRDFFLCEQNLP